MKRALNAAATAALAFAAPATAAVFNFAFVSSTFSLLTTGTLTTSDTLDAAGGYDVLSIGGFVGGAAITGLAPAGTALADNILFTTAGASHVDFDGISFYAAGLTYNVYNAAAGAAGDRFFDVATTTITPGTFGIVPLASAVPEPATWATLAIGLGLFGVTARSRAKRGHHTAV